MKRPSLREFDLRVRLGGVGLLLLATALLAMLPAHRGDPASQPGVVEVCLALVAVCSGSVGASFLFVGRQLFEPVPAPRSAALLNGDTSRGER